MLFPIDATWEYLVLPGALIPSDPSSVTVPATGWAPGQAPFGHLGTTGPGSEFPPNTSWPVDDRLWVRRYVTLDGRAPVLLKGKIEQAALFYWDGIYIGGVNPTNAARSETPVWYMVLPLSLATAGDHQLAIYCFDDLGGSTGDATYLSCEADYLPPMITTPPQAPVRESWAWKTDVIEAYNGSEERHQVRNNPRQGLRYNYPINNLSQAPAFFNQLYGAHHLEWLVPIWFEAQQVGAVSAGVSSINCDTTHRDLRPSSLVILWESPEKWQVMGLDLVNASSVTLVGKTEAFSEAWLIPVRFARIDTTTEKKTNGHTSEYDVTYAIQDNATFTSADPAQFLGNDIYFDPGLLGGSSITDNIIRDVKVHDEELGEVSWRSVWDYTRVSRPYRQLAEGPEEARALRNWLHRRAGKYRAFWQPSFEADLRLLSTGTIETSIIVVPDDYERWASSRAHIAIETKGGVWYARTITGTLRLDAERLQLTLDSLVNVAADDVNRVCYLGLKRLDADRVELTWIGGGCVQMDVRTVELNP